MAIIASLALSIVASAPAWADDVVIQRNVTVREQPRQQSEALAYPPIGTRLDVLDDGRRVRGYYHVRLPDGREGWVYQTFVRLVPDEEPLAPPPPGTAAADRAAIHFIDVDQGASALLEFSCGAILVDAGVRGAEADRHLIDYLEQFFARRTDLRRRLAAVFVTHAHADHDNSLIDVADRFTVEGFVYNGFEDPRVVTMLERANRTPRIPVEAVQANDFSPEDRDGFTNSVIDPLACGGTNPEVRVLSGGRDRDPEWSSADNRNPNNHSVVVRVDFGAASLLITGDLELPGIGDLLRRYAGTGMLDVDVYAVGHHGADDATTRAFLTALTPEIAVISAGRHNTIRIPRSAWDHGHPKLSVIQLLEGAITRRRTPAVNMMLFERQEGQPRQRTIRDAIYSTSRDGDVVITATSSGDLRVRTSR